jgi:hypothetical protein
LSTSELQIADSATDLVVLGIAGGIPERSGDVVLECDQGGCSTGAASAQVLLAGPRQRDPDALPPISLANSKAIHVSSPPIPAGNQSADNLTIALGNQKGGWGTIGSQVLDAIQAVRRTCVLAPYLGP